MTLGKELRALRDRCGLTAEAVSHDLGISKTKLTRVESGDIPLPKLADLERLMDRYGVTDLDDRTNLLNMQRESLKDEPYVSTRKSLPSGMPMYLGLERDAVAIRGYEPSSIHGLLQTEAYARAQMGSAKIVEERTTAAVEDGVATRMERKDLLFGPEEPAVHIIMLESCLRTAIGSAEIMRDQYAEIVRLNQRRNIEVQVMPENLFTYRAAWNFTHLEFPELSPVVQSDSNKATTMFSKASDVGQYLRNFNDMAKNAPGPSETPHILKRLEEELWT
ncbi:helix-turn-helix domain-containing protein [Streptomyces sp. NPDC002690]